MIDERGFEPEFEMGNYPRYLDIRLVLNKEIIRNSAYNLAILLNIPK